MSRRNKYHLDRFTPFKNVNDISQFFTEGTALIFRENLTGIYLTGSLSYGAFNYDSSDIDLTVILQNPISSNELNAIKRFHV